MALNDAPESVLGNFGTIVALILGANGNRWYAKCLLSMQTLCGRRQTQVQPINLRKRRDNAINTQIKSLSLVFVLTTAQAFAVVEPSTNPANMISIVRQFIADSWMIWALGSVFFSWRLYLIMRKFKKTGKPNLPGAIVMIKLIVIFVVLLVASLILNSIG